MFIKFEKLCVNLNNIEVIVYSAEGYWINFHSTGGETYSWMLKDKKTYDKCVSRLELMTGMDML